MPGNLRIDEKGLSEFREYYLKHYYWVKSIISKDESAILTSLGIELKKLSTESQSYEALYDCALILAVENNKREVVRALLQIKNFKNINDVFQTEPSEAGGTSGMSLLKDITSRNYPVVNSVINFFIEQRFIDEEILAVVPTYRTLLGHAAYHGLLDMVTFLVEELKVNVNTAVPEDLQEKVSFDKDACRQTPLREVLLGSTSNYVPKNREHVKVAECLLLRGAKGIENTNFSCDTNVGSVFHQYVQFQRYLKPQIESRIDSSFLSYYNAKHDTNVVKIIVGYLDDYRDFVQKEDNKGIKKKIEYVKI